MATTYRPADEDPLTIDQKPAPTGQVIQQAQLQAAPDTAPAPEPVVKVADYAQAAPPPAPAEIATVPDVPQVPHGTAKTGSQDQPDPFARQTVEEPTILHRRQASRRAEAQIQQRDQDRAYREQVQQQRQADRDRLGRVRALKDAGVEMDVDEFGDARPRVDAAGRTLYKPAVIEPFHQDEDGTVSTLKRDVYGQTQKIPLKPVTDPQTGEKMVTGPDGVTKVSIGKDEPFLEKKDMSEAGKVAGFAKAQMLDLKNQQKALKDREKALLDEITLNGAEKNPSTAQKVAIESAKGELVKVRGMLDPLQKQHDALVPQYDALEADYRAKQGKVIARAQADYAARNPDSAAAKALRGETVTPPPDPPVVEEIAKQKTVPEDGDFWRGAKVSLLQLKPLAQGTLALIGATAEKVVGEGGRATALKEWGLKGYADGMAKTTAIAKENDDVTKAWGKAKQGDIGALVDWAQYAGGYLIGQAGETVAISLLAGLAGGAATAETGPGAVIGAGVGAGTGLVAKQAFKATIKSGIEGLVTRQAAKLIAEEGLKTGAKIGEKEALEMAAGGAMRKAAASRTAQSMAMNANAFVQEAGGIFPEAIQQAKDEGREFTGSDLAKVWGWATVAARLEKVGDKAELDALLGRGRYAQMAGGGGRAATAIRSALGLTLTEASTEGGQTLAERLGAGQALTGEEAKGDFINSILMGAFGGAALGGPSAFLHHDKSAAPRQQFTKEWNDSNKTDPNFRPISAEQAPTAQAAIIAATDPTLKERADALTTEFQNQQVILQDSTDPAEKAAAQGVIDAMLPDAQAIEHERTTRRQAVLDATHEAIGPKGGIKAHAAIKAAAGAPLSTVETTALLSMRDATAAPIATFVDGKVQLSATAPAAIGRNWPAVAKLVEFSLAKNATTAAQQNAQLSNPSAAKSQPVPGPGQPQGQAQGNTQTQGQGASPNVPAGQGQGSGRNVALPSALAGAKPRYSYGQKRFDLNFASDIDKAAYITAQGTRSKQDAAFLKHVMDATGMSEAEVRAHGAKVRDAIKALAKNAPAGGLDIPSQFAIAAAPSAVTLPSTAQPVASAQSPSVGHPGPPASGTQSVPVPSGAPPKVQSSPESQSPDATEAGGGSPSAQPEADAGGPQPGMEPWEFDKLPLDPQWGAANRSVGKFNLRGIVESAKTVESKGGFGRHPDQVMKFTEIVLRFSSGKTETIFVGMDLPQSIVGQHIKINAGQDFFERLQANSIRKDEQPEAQPVPDAQAQAAANRKQPLRITPKQVEEARALLNADASVETIAKLKQRGAFSVLQPGAPRQGMAFATDPRTGMVTVHIGELAQALRGIAPEGHAKWVADALDHELRHHITVKAISRAEIEAVGKNLTADERTALEQLYGSAFTDDFAAGAEAIAVFGQAKDGRSAEAYRLFTEKARTDPGFADLIRRWLAYARDLAKGLTGKMSDRLREGIERVQSVLDEIAKGETKPAEAAPPAEPSADQSPTPPPAKKPARKAKQPKPPAGGTASSEEDATPEPESKPSGPKSKLSAEDQAAVRKEFEGLFASQPDFESREVLNAERAIQKLDAFDPNDPETWPRNLGRGAEPIAADEPETWKWALPKADRAWIDANDGDFTYDPAAKKWAPEYSNIIEDDPRTDEDLAKEAERMNRMLATAQDVYGERRREAKSRADDLRKQVDTHGFLYASQPAEQLSIPDEKYDGMRRVSKIFLSNGIRTPEAMATELEAMFGGKARPYSESLWDVLGTIDKSLRGTHDWNAIFASIDLRASGVTGSGAEATGPLAVALHETIRDLLVAGEAIDRRRLAELAKDSGLDTKRIDEAAELGVVLAAREIAQKPGTPSEKFDAMTRLYENQPNLTAKTSTSKINQAYSTPMPLAYLATELAPAADNRSVQESTAGNGALIMDREGLMTLVNELDPTRADNLRAQGFSVSSEDATQWTPTTKADAVRLNPPFGSVTGESGKKTWTIDGVTTDQIDHAIVLQSLGNMTDTGRAVLIIGGSQATDRNDRRAHYTGVGGNRGEFFKKLYAEYGVIDHFTVDGDLYKKQGAGWPVDVIVIAGRKPSPIQLPNVNPPRILNSWDELKSELSKSDEQRISDGQYNEQQDRDETSASLAGIRNAFSGGQRPSPEPAARPDGGSGSERPGGNAEQRPADNSGETVLRDERPERDGLGDGATDESDSGSRGLRVEQDKTDEQKQKFHEKYVPVSEGKSFDIETPSNLAKPQRDALQRIQKEVGKPLREYVREKLGYGEKEDISKYFAAEQLDALAGAIYNLETGGALILGDMAGVGKGRVVAGLIEYAKREGLTPVFVTKKVTLYSAMLGDFHNIGRTVNPVYTDNGLSILHPVTKEEIRTKGDQRALMNQIERSGELPQGSDAVFTTYYQIGSSDDRTQSKESRNSVKASGGVYMPGDRMRAMTSLAGSGRLLLIMDESHLAAGDSMVGRRVRQLLANPRVKAYYSSATFSKRADAMPLYSKTNLRKAAGNPSDLVEVFDRGGAVLQQVASRMLAEDGQLIRRERTYDGIPFETHINYDTEERDRRLGDEYTTGLRGLLDMSNRIRLATQRMNQIMSRLGEQWHVPTIRLEAADFASQIHNFINQYLFAIKSEAALQQALKAIKQGRETKDGTVKKHKVVIAVQNTMEQPIAQLAESNRPLEFTSLLLKTLDGLRMIKTGGSVSKGTATYFEITREAPAEFRNLTDAQLEDQLMLVVTNEDGQQVGTVREPVAAELFRRMANSQFVAAEEEIKQLDLGGMPISPIDHIRDSAEAQGIRTGEITGRLSRINTDGELYQRDPREATDEGQLAILDQFNNSDLDLMILNQSGSTGISAHADVNFKRHDPRMMIVVQPHLDINEFVQMLGRIFRSGQVEDPRYMLLQTALPAELRPATIMGGKMKLLNANTTSNTDSEVSQGVKSMDMFNQYGDGIVYQFLRENPVFTRELGHRKVTRPDGTLRSFSDISDDFPEDGKFIQSVANYVGIQRVDDQDMFWDDTRIRYAAQIAALDQIGENKLKATSEDLSAETISKEIYTPGDPNGTSAFDAPSYVETVAVRPKAPPAEPSEVLAKAKEAERGRVALIADYKKQAQAWIERYIAQRKAKNVGDWSEIEPRERARLQAQYSEVWGQLQRVGNPVQIQTAGGVRIGAITGVEIDPDAPLVPSKQVFIVANNTLKREFKFFGSQMAERVKDMDPDTFTEQYNATREDKATRIVLTGNLVSAYVQARGEGAVTVFTRADGSVDNGILMPATFDPHAAASANVQDAAHAERLLADGKELSGDDGKVKIRSTATANGMELIVPASQANGGKYWRDPALNAAMQGGEMRQQGANMVGRIADMSVVLARLKAVGTTMTYEQDAPQSLGASQPGGAPLPTLHASNATVTGPGLIMLGASQPFTAYHGTPHKVDKFSLDKIGTGEGAQVYGWGLYFAERHDVAEQYREQLTKSRFSDALKDTAKYWVTEAGGDREKAVKLAASFAGGKADPELVRAITDKPGHTYTVDLDVEPEELLDWDKPLSEQSERVKAALESLGVHPDEGRGDEYYDDTEDDHMGINGNANGAALYSSLGTYEHPLTGERRKRTAAQVSEALRAAGIPGIRYLDQGSRFDTARIPVLTAKLEGAKKSLNHVVNSSFSTPSQIEYAKNQVAKAAAELDSTERVRDEPPTYNYVLFDEDRIKITHENGNLVTMSEALGASQPQTETPEFVKWFGKSKVVDENGEPIVMYHGTAAKDGAFTEFKKEKIRPVDYDIPLNGFWFSSNKNTSPAMQNAKAVIPVFLSIKNPASAEVWMRVAREVSKDGELRDGARSYDDETRFRLQDMGFDGIQFDGKPKVDIAALDKNREVEFRTVRGAKYKLKYEDEYGGLDLYQVRDGQSEHITGYEDLADFMSQQEEAWVAFEPTQIKSATANSGAFDPANPSMLGASQPGPIEVGQALTDDQTPIIETLDDIKGYPEAESAVLIKGNEAHLYDLTGGEPTIEGSALLSGDQAAIDALKNPDIPKARNLNHLDEIYRDFGSDKALIVHAQVGRMELLDEDGESIATAYLKPQTGWLGASQPPRAAPTAAPLGFDVIQAAVQNLAPVERKVFRMKRAGEFDAAIMAATKLNEKGVENAYKVAVGKLDRAYALATGVQGQFAKALLEPKGQRTVGRPDGANVANPAKGEQSRRMVDAARADYEPGVQKRQTLRDEADRRIAADEPGEYKRLVQAAEAGEVFDPQDMMTAKKLVAKNALRAVKAGNLERIYEHAVLNRAYDMVGTAAARTLGLRVDESLSPAERAAEKLSSALLTPPQKLRAKIEKAKTQAEKDALLKDWTRQMKRLKQRLKDIGLDLDAMSDQQITDFLKDRVKAQNAIHAIADAKSDAWDALYEYWISSILSGPATNIANVVGNAANAFWDFTAQRFAEASVNLIAGDPNSATFGEMRHIWAGFLPGMAEGFKRAAKSWRNESTVFEEEVLGSEGTHKFHLGHAIGGGGLLGKAIGDQRADKAGRIVRIPLRLLLMADEMSKSVVARMQVGAEAYRLAKAKGLEGQALTDFMRAEMVVNPDAPTDSWRAAASVAKTLAFQDDLGNFGKSFIKLRDSLPGLRYFAPFVQTIANIFKIGLRKSPLGSANMIYRLGKGAVDKTFNDGWSYTRKEAVAHAAEQMLAWGLFFVLSGLAAPGDDDLPEITGTVPYQGTKRGERDLAYRVAPPQSIRWNGAWHSYARIEPFGTILSTMVDTLNVMRKAQNGGDYTQALGSFFEHLTAQLKDKTFARGIGDFLNAIQDGASATEWVGNFATSWVPNVVRVGTKEASDAIQEANDPEYRSTIREQKVWGHGEEWGDRLANRLQYRALPTEGNAPPPKVDLWGRDVERERGANPATDFLYRTLSPIKLQSTADVEKVDLAISRFNNNFPDSIFAPSIPEPKWTKSVTGPNGTKVEKTISMTDQEYRKFLVMGGRMALARVKAEGIDYDHPTEKDMEKITKALAAAHKTARDKVWEERIAGK